MNRGWLAAALLAVVGPVNAADLSLEKLKEQRRQLVEDEKRLRDNLAAVGRDTALYKQTLDKLGDTEATITTLSTAIAKSVADMDTSREELQRFVSALSL